MESNNLQHLDIITPEYKKLSQTLNVSLDSFLSSAFTGYPTTDILILQNLSDGDLINVCSTNRYLNNICNDESFWMNRLILKYGDKLGSPIEIKNKYIPDGTSWKEYYLWLSSYVNYKIPEFVDLIAYRYNREDLKKLFGIQDQTYLPHNRRTFLYSPKKIDDNLRGFLTEADFGLVDPNDPNSPRLNDYLLGVTDGITTKAILIGLFTLYMYKHKLFMATLVYPSPLMIKWLGITKPLKYFELSNFYGNLEPIVIEDHNILNSLVSESQLVNRNKKIYQ